jgi:hypothetical protein
MPSRPRLLHRQRLQQPRQFIRVSLERHRIPLRNPPRRIRRPLPRLNIVAEQLSHQRPHGHAIAADIPSQRPSLLQPEAFRLQPFMNPHHAAKYKPRTG